MTRMLILVALGLLLAGCEPGDANPDLCAAVFVFNSTVNCQQRDHSCGGKPTTTQIVNPR